MFIACYIVTGFLTAAVYATGMLRGRRDQHHVLGFTVPFTFAGVAALVQPLSGHFAGMRLYADQPSKLAAMELATTSEDGVPLQLGGILIDGEVRYALPIPQLGSLLSRSGFNRVVPGLDELPPQDRPPATIVHLSFQAMIAAGLLMVAIALWFTWRRRRRAATRRFRLDGVPACRHRRRRPRRGGAGVRLDHH